MKFLIKLLCLAIAGTAVALLLWWLSDGYPNWQVATWFNDLSI